MFRRVGAISASTRPPAANALPANDATNPAATSNRAFACGSLTTIAVSGATARGALSCATTMGLGGGAGGVLGAGITIATSTGSSVGTAAASEALTSAWTVARSRLVAVAAAGRIAGGVGVGASGRVVLVLAVAAAGRMVGGVAVGAAGCVVLVLAVAVVLVVVFAVGAAGRVVLVLAVAAAGRVVLAGVLALAVPFAGFLALG